jgi:hypothetical protein
MLAINIEQKQAGSGRIFQQVVGLSGRAGLLMRLGKLRGSGRVELNIKVSQCHIRNFEILMLSQPVPFKKL